MKYRHNADDKKVRAGQKAARTIDILGAVDLVLAGSILAGVLVLWFVFAPCVPGMICIVQPLTALLIIGLMALMTVVGLIAAVRFGVAKAQKLELTRDVAWKVGIMMAVGLAALVRVVYFFMN